MQAKLKEVKAKQAYLEVANMTRQIFILPAKFTSHELQDLRHVLHTYEPEYEVVPEITTETSYIVTKLFQPLRLERELRSLSLSKATVIFQLSVFLHCLTSLSNLPGSRAWCIYRPSVYHTRLNTLPEPGLPLGQPKDAQVSPGGGREPSTHGENPQTCLPALLRHESTMEPTALRPGQGSNKNKKYACQRRTPLICANEALVKQLDLLRLARILQADSIGERAYSTAIASIRALDVKIETESDVINLEGCANKLVGIVREWLHSTHITEVDQTWCSSEFKTLFSFWNCHGVGAATAREWYFNRGYRDLNDAIQDWDRHSRSIQIGLKYYEDFLIKIPRAEVQAIGSMVLEAANYVSSTNGFSSKVALQICGGYRRGKLESGDVDVVLTHESCYGHADMMNPILARLEELGYLTNVISSLHERDASKAPGSGISIALVVIKGVSPSTSTHRRLDIIVCPPQSFITAVTGWSGSTTIERDLRRYLNDVKQWTFDSTGISDPISKARIEDASFHWHEKAETEELEKALFSFFELDYIPPEFRNAG